MEFGDIISFRQGQSVITHRITAVIEEDGKTLYRAKGDNNNAEDSGEISKTLVEGKVVNTIPAIGKLVILLQGKTVIIIAVILIYIYIVRANAKNRKKRERHKKRLSYERSQQKGNITKYAKKRK